MGKNPREPKAVKALIKKHTKPKPPAARTVQGGQVIPSASLWARIRRRRG